MEKQEISWAGIGEISTLFSRYLAESAVEFDRRRAEFDRRMAEEAAARVAGAAEFDHT